MDTQEFIDNRLFHEIHVSEIREWQKCEWSWDWKYTQKYYPKRVAKPLEFGTVMHYAFEGLYNPETWHDKEIREALAITNLVAKNNEQHTQAIQNFGFVFNNENVTDDYEKREKLGLDMLEYYITEILPKEEQFTPLFVEKSFIAPINGVYCKCPTCYEKWIRAGNYLKYWNGLPVVLEGKIDIVLQYENDKVWIRDWKNVASFSNNVEWLDNDFQMNLYLWALWNMGLDIGGFEYFELKKVVPEIPQPMSRRSSGRIFSVDKNKNYEYASYVDTVSTEDQAAYEAGAYDDYIEWLQNEGPQYYRINRIKKTDDSMYAIESQLIIIAQKITQVREHQILAPSPAKWNCIYCDFLQPCIERMSGRDYSSYLNIMYDKRSKHYYEE